MAIFGPRVGGGFSPLLESSRGILFAVAILAQGWEVGFPPYSNPLEEFCLERGVFGLAMDTMFFP